MRSSVVVCFHMFDSLFDEVFAVGTCEFSAMHLSLELDPWNLEPMAELLVSRAVVMLPQSHSQRFANESSNLDRMQ